MRQEVETDDKVVDLMERLRASLGQAAKPARRSSGARAKSGTAGRKRPSRRAA
ncbi:hypothetical protein D3C83_11880 [compost metagenome]